MPWGSTSLKQRACFAINSEYAAKRALGAWLRGKHEGITDWDDHGPYTIGYKVIPVSTRKREDMQVVEIVLQPQLERTEP